MTDLSLALHSGQELPARTMQDSRHWRWWPWVRAADELGSARYVRLIKGRRALLMMTTAMGCRVQGHSCH